MDAPGETQANQDTDSERQEEVCVAQSPDESSKRDDVPQQRDDNASDSGPHDEDDAHEEKDEEYDDNNDNDEEEEEDDEEPMLKYAYLTKQIQSVYRNGDATSTFLAAGDKMIIGTHNGNIHVMSLPFLRSLRIYHAHSASVTSVSMSPFPPPSPVFKVEPFNKQTSEEQGTSVRSAASSFVSRTGPSNPQSTARSTVPSNAIYIGTSSIDGNVCVSSLVDQKDVLLRNFGRPVQAVALSPEYKSDRTFLSGGRAGDLILTVGGRIGTSANATTIGGAAATASSWLGSIGLGSNTGKDTVIHSGEGAISTIKWSLSGKYVAWVNEEGIKIMRSHLHLDSSEFDLAWKRVSHTDRPNRPGWEDMTSVWKARAEWVDLDALDANADSNLESEQSGPRLQKLEKLIVGWGGTVWVINVYPQRPNKNSREPKLGSAEVATILRTDCLISGISMYTPSLITLLAHIEVDGKSLSEDHRRQKALEPELRIIDIDTKEEISADTLSVTRYENLTSSDYHMCVLPPAKNVTAVAQRGALGAIGNGLWDATMYSARLFSSGASIRSVGSGDKGSGKVESSFASRRLQDEAPSKEIQGIATTTGMKVFIHSPYDCVVAVERDLSDHLAWLDTHGKYEEAWNLVDEHPEAASAAGENLDVLSEVVLRSQTSLNEFFADDRASIMTTGRPVASVNEQEKRRIGERWIEQLIDQQMWEKAAEVCRKVLQTASRWEHWVSVFIRADKLDEITPHIPTDLQPPLPSAVYENVLKHYVTRDCRCLSELLDSWPIDLFDASRVAETIEEELKLSGVTIESEEWRILTESLAKLLAASGHYRRALRCYVRLQNPDAVMSLVREHRLLDAVSEDIPAFIRIRVTREQMRSAPTTKLEELTAEPIKLLVSEAYTGVVRPETVVKQLLAVDKRLLLFFYIRSLWREHQLPHESTKPRRSRGAFMRDAANKLASDEGKALVDTFADTAVELFAEYDRPLLMEFLQSSTAYTFETATSICERRNYTPELIYLLSKMGQTKRALNLILTGLKDVSQAISFAKSQDDPDLWEDLLEYSMDKPRFIHGLLVEAGTAIDPIKLVRRIPSGLEIEGLRDGLTRLIREHDLQASIGQGAAKVLQSEVALGMDTLRRGQQRGIKFSVLEGEGDEATDSDSKQGDTRSSGRCGGCLAPFNANDPEILVGFACGHVFHLSHVNPEPAASAPETPSADAAAKPSPLSSCVQAGDEGSSSALRTVGPKVTTARLLRDRIGSGCRVCVSARHLDELE